MSVIRTFAVSCVSLVFALPLAAQDDDGEAPADVVTTASGLQYEVLKEGGDGPHPKLGDRVTVHYTGTLTDGTKVDSSRDRGQPASFRLGEVIEGWNEGLQLMTPGARYRFTIPGELGYGAAGSPPRVPPNATLLFDIELIDVTPGVPIPEFTAGDQERQQTTESGLVYEFLEEGEGEPPAADDVLEMHYTWWNSDGKLFDSTARREQPIKASTEQMSLPFLKEAPLLMREGARCRFEVPAELAFGDRAIPSLPAGSTTVWEIELVRIIDPLPIPEFVLPVDEELTTTASGLRYHVVKEGSGEPPAMGQQVRVHYAGWLLDGTPFDSSFKRGEPATFRLGQVIQGWNEGLQLMRPGAVYRLVIPPELAYGERGAPPAIGPGETLVFQVELLPAE